MPTGEAPPTLRRSSRVRRQTDVTNIKISPRPVKKQRVEKTAPAPIAPSRSTYVPSKYTLFLDSRFQTIHWTPVEPKLATHVHLSKFLELHKNNVHDYFVSRRAATFAALKGNIAHVYRHIGSVVLEKFSPSEREFDLEAKRRTEHINLAHIIRKSECANRSVLDALYSLTLKGQRPYESPYIVALATRKDFCAVNPTSGSDLTVEIYIGRLLFELIAYEDTKVLFSALRPSRPFKPLPESPQYAQCLGKSPAPAKDDRFTTSGLLRRVESTGYASLTTEQREKVKNALTVDLYPFQEQTVRWMLDKENDAFSINEYFWEERSFSDSGNGEGGHFYYFPKAGEVRLHKPPQTRGGMVTEEMGLGKTVEALALIAAQKKEHAIVEMDIYCEKKPPNVSFANGSVTTSRTHQRNEDTSVQIPCPLNFEDELLNFDADTPYPKSIRVRRWPPKTTLVLCPKSLLNQWKREAEERAPNLSIVIWEPYLSKDSPGTSWEVAVGEHAKDIVLATYDALKNDKWLFKITWKRLILDEAQVTRRSSAQVAKDTFNLRSESRFLMTGTPIVKDVDDIRGELAFLRIWPFTLFADGFWESQIYFPFLFQRSSTLLDHLLRVTMMRHTKAQQLSINLPPRSYETIEVELRGSHRAVYCFVLACCLEEVASWDGQQTSCPRSLRTLLRILLSTCISPVLLNLMALDLARRNTWARSHGPSGSSLHSGNVLTLVKMSAIDAIRFLAETGTRIARDSKRVRATPHASQPLRYEDYLKMHVDDLVTIVEAKGLINASQTVPSKERLAQLAAGGLHRIHSDSLSQLQESITKLGLKPIDVAQRMSRNAAIALLTVHFEVSRTNPSGAIHEAGFLALTKLIEKNETPPCPICLTAPMERISLTKCGHFYCVDCITSMFGRGNMVKCALCRRLVVAEGAIEIVHEAEQAGCSVEDEEADVEGENAASVRQAITFISESDARRYSNASRPTAAQTWAEYEGIGLAPRRFRGVGRDPDLPSLNADFLRHIAATAADDAVAPKLFALRSLIESCDPETKFCVVAETTESLKGIAVWLERQGIACVGVGSEGWYSAHAKSVGEAAQDFTADSSIKVFLLNTANAAGLTLTAANCVVFMESMVRLTDEMQAAARVHRIGQKRPVRIVRIVARNTIEEQIMFRRVGVHNASLETNALISPTGGELPGEEIRKLFLPDETQAREE